MLYNTKDFQVKSGYLTLFCFGIIAWSLFFYWGNPSFNAYDWRVLNSWLMVVKEALKSSQIPLYVSFFESEYISGEYLWGNRYFALPYIISSPQVIFLKYIDLKQFYLLHFFTTYCVAFIFYCKWCELLSLKFSGKILLYGLFFFSGPLVGRMTVGHLQLTGYFLIPAYLYLLYLLYSAPPLNFLSMVKRFTLGLSLLIIYMGLQGSLHVLQQWLILSFVIFITDFKKLGVILVSYGVAFLGLSHLILPNLLYGQYLSDAGRLYQTGLPINSNFVIFDSGALLKWSSIFASNVFTSISSLFNLNTVQNDGSWEYSLFVGSSFCAYSILTIAIAIRFGYLKVALLNKLKIVFLIFLGIGGAVYLHRFASYFLYFPAIDRLSVRILIYPLIILSIYIVYLSNILSYSNHKYRYLSYIFTFAICGEFLFNFFQWRVKTTDYFYIEDSIKLVPYANIYNPESIARVLGYENLVFYVYAFSIFFNFFLFSYWLLRIIIKSRVIK